MENKNTFQIFQILNNFVLKRFLQKPLKSPSKPNSQSFTELSLNEIGLGA